ncbi:hypothetical protein [Acidiplasma sp.]|nr:hypothetical protein [Acidiplasma sp.]
MDSDAQDTGVNKQVKKLNLNTKDVFISVLLAIEAVLIVFILVII